jgi:uncharacterized protein (DUF1778 family)
MASKLEDPLDRQVQFNIRMSSYDKLRIEAAARASRQSLTEFTHTALAEKADEILAHHEQIVLSERDYELFVAMMTSESEPTDIAKEEASEFKNGQIDGAHYRW